MKKALFVILAGCGLALAQPPIDTGDHKEKEKGDKPAVSGSRRPWTKSGRKS